MKMKDKRLTVLGIRGLPANHGGFETFAQYLCMFLISRGWEIQVYCQEGGVGKIYETDWQGIKRIHIPVEGEGPLGTVIFDLKSVLHARRYKGLHLTLGYNTACFNVVQRLFGITNIINMDGIEWKRQKWGAVAKLWFRINESLACYLGDHLIADHPGIEDHLATRVSRQKMTMIPYGASDVGGADESVLVEFGLAKERYTVIIARPEPENSILEIVEAFSAKPRSYDLVVLGSFLSSNPYHRKVLSAASDGVIFLGAIYDSHKVAALRFFSRFYIHGHQVGGTNPSLVEGLGAGCAILAHDNKFNRWVAGDGAIYFKNKFDLSMFFEHQILDERIVIKKRDAAKRRFLDSFQWNQVLSKYESLFLKFL